MISTIVVGVLLGLVLMLLIDWLIGQWKLYRLDHCPVMRPCTNPAHGGHLISKHDYRETGYWTGTSTPCYQCKHCGRSL